MLFNASRPSRRNQRSPQAQLKISRTVHRLVSTHQGTLVSLAFVRCRNRCDQHRCHRIAADDKLRFASQSDLQSRILRCRFEHINPDYSPRMPFPASRLSGCLPLLAGFDLFWGNALLRAQRPLPHWCWQGDGAAHQRRSSLKFECCGGGVKPRRRGVCI